MISTSLSNKPLLYLEGMHIEGIYRVNGNQADITLIEQKVEESESEKLLF